MSFHGSTWGNQYKGSTVIHETKTLSPKQILPTQTLGGSFGFVFTRLAVAPLLAIDSQSHDIFHFVTRICKAMDNNVPESFQSTSICQSLNVQSSNCTIHDVPP